VFLIIVLRQLMGFSFLWLIRFFLIGILAETEERAGQAVEFATPAGRSLVSEQKSAVRNHSPGQSNRLTQKKNCSLVVILRPLTRVS
jgi:hypothetical protein